MTKDNSQIYFSTLLTEDTKSRLTEFARQYVTGLGRWDYGVAIQILLDFYEQHSSVAQINLKLDLLLNAMQDNLVEPEQPKQEDTGTEMLGGEVLNK